MNQLKNTKGFTIVELCVSIAITAVISIMIISLTINMNLTLAQNIKYKQFNEEKIILYKELATNFSTHNITKIEQIENGFSINYSKYSLYENIDIVKTNNIYIDNGNLFIDNQKFNKTNYIEYTGIKIKKIVIPSNHNNFYLILSIEGKQDTNSFSLDIYYLNDTTNLVLPSNIEVGEI